MLDEIKATTTIQRFFKRYHIEKQTRLEQRISQNHAALLLEKMNLRFQCMRAVAAAKFPVQKPIEDKEQEARVIAAVKQLAITSGITNLEIIDRIFQCNITLSKAIQRPYYDNIWSKAPRDTQSLLDNAYLQLMGLAKQVGLVLPLEKPSSLHFTDVLALARDVIQQLNHDIIIILSNPTPHQLHIIPQEELEFVFKTMLANYMTPHALQENVPTIELLAKELIGFSL